MFITAFIKSVAITLISIFLSGCIPPGLGKPSSPAPTNSGKPSIWDKDYDAYADIKARKKAFDASKVEFYKSNKLASSPPTPEQAKIIANWEAVKAKYAKAKKLNTQQSIEVGAAIAPLLLAADNEWQALNPSPKEAEIIGRLGARESEVDPAILPLYQAVVKHRALHPQNESNVGVHENELNKRIKELVIAIRMGPYDGSKFKSLGKPHLEILNDAYPDGGDVFLKYLMKSHTEGTPEFKRAQQIKPENGWKSSELEGSIIQDFGLSYCDEKLNSKDRNHFSDGGIMMAAFKDAAEFMADKIVSGTGPKSIPAKLSAILLTGRMESPVLQGIVSSVPVVGSTIAAYELYSGNNVFTGKKLTPAERILSLASIVPGVGALGRTASGMIKSGVIKNVKVKDFLEKDLLKKAYATANSSGKYLNTASAVAFSNTVDDLAGDYSPSKYAKAKTDEFNAKMEAMFEKESESAIKWLVLGKT